VPPHDGAVSRSAGSVQRSEPTPVSRVQALELLEVPVVQPAAFGTQLRGTGNRHEVCGLFQRRDGAQPRGAQEGGPERPGGLGEEGAGDLGGIDHLGKVRGVHVEERAERRAPTAVLRPGVVEEGRVRRVRRHGEPARAPVKIDSPPPHDL
jgi:hypothetical protein